MIIIDNFIRDEQLLLEVQKEEYWKQRVSASWKDSSSEVVPNIFEHIGNMVWQTFPMVDTAAGYEYWTHILGPNVEAANDKTYTAGDSLHWHQDRDEHLFVSKQELSLPLIGCVYYAHKELPVGGYLVVKRENDYMEWIEPKPNRLVIFESNLVHGVDKVQSGERKSLVTNVWLEKPSAENFV